MPIDSPLRQAHFVQFSQRPTVPDGWRESGAKSIDKVWNFDHLR